MKRMTLIAIALCLVMASGFGVTGAVSAAQAGTSSIHQYPIMLGKMRNGVWTSTGEVGKLTLDTDTGHIVATINFAKADAKQLGKERAGGPFFLSLYNPNAKPRYVYINGALTNLETPINEGGTAHMEGTLDVGNSQLATWLNTWADDANTIAINN